MLLTNHRGACIMRLCYYPSWLLTPLFLCL
nr:MAG TPA: hypothetical protein [Caudoviricetes sp.]